MCDQPCKSSSSHFDGRVAAPLPPPFHAQLDRPNIYVQVERPSHDCRDVDNAPGKEPGHDGATSSDNNAQASVRIAPTSRIATRKGSPNELQLMSQCSSPPATSRDRGIKRAKQRSREFLVLTLGLIRRLVESASETCRPPHQIGHSSVTTNAKSGHWEYDSNHADDIGREGLRSKRQFDPPPPQPPTPPWYTIAMVLRQVRGIDAQQGVHGRLRDVLGPTLLGALARLIVRTFVPPSSKDASHSERHRGSHVYFNHSTGKDLDNVSELTAFLGSMVRDILWRNCTDPVHDDNVIGDRPNSNSDCRVVGNGNSASDSARDGEVRVRAGGNERSRSTAPNMSNNPTRDINRPGLDRPNPDNVRAEDLPAGNIIINSANVVLNVQQHASNSGGDGSSNGGYSTDTFHAEDSSHSSCPENSLLGNQGDNKQRPYEGHCSGRNGSSVDGGVPDSTTHQGLSSGETIMAEGVAAADEQSIESNGDGSLYTLSGCLAALADMQRANSHVHIPGLADDARAFANKLGRLANVERGHGRTAPSSDGSEDVRRTRGEQLASPPDIRCRSSRMSVSYRRRVSCTDAELGQNHEVPDHKRFHRKSVADTDRDSANVRRNIGGEMFRIESSEGVDETSPNGAWFISGSGTFIGDGANSSVSDECSTLTPAFHVYSNEDTDHWQS